MNAIPLNAGDSHTLIPSFPFKECGSAMALGPRGQVTGIGGRLAKERLIILITAVECQLFHNFVAHALVRAAFTLM
jgi:hypothetical protein